MPAQRKTGPGDGLCPLPRNTGCGLHRIPPLSASSASLREKRAFPGFRRRSLKFPRPRVQTRGFYGNARAEAQRAQRKAGPGDGLCPLPRNTGCGLHRIPPLSASSASLREKQAFPGFRRRSLKFPRPTGSDEGLLWECPRRGAEGAEEDGAIPKIRGHLRSKIGVL